ncbi:MAG: hypothetical protein WA957_07750 [Alteraurantiacibacter sp.]
MIELIPVLLFLMEWHPDRPREVQLTRVEQVFANAEDCEAAGVNLVAEIIGRESDVDTVIEYSCQPVPPREEFDMMFEENFGGSAK